MYKFVRDVILLFLQVTYHPQKSNPQFFYKEITVHIYRAQKLKTNNPQKYD